MAATLGPCHHERAPRARTAPAPARPEAPVQGWCESVGVQGWWHLSQEQGHGCSQHSVAAGYGLRSSRGAKRWVLDPDRRDAGQSPVESGGLCPRREGNPRQLQLPDSQPQTHGHPTLPLLSRRDPQSQQSWPKALGQDSFVLPGPLSGSPPQPSLTQPVLPGRARPFSTAPKLFLLLELPWTPWTTQPRTPTRSSPALPVSGTPLSAGRRCWVPGVALEGPGGV